MVHVRNVVSSLVVWSLAGLAALSLGACGSADGGTAAPAADASTGGAEAAPSEPGIAVGVTPAIRREMADLYATSATLRADRRATVVARTAGVVEKILVEEGDQVAEAQELAVLENTEQRIEFGRANTTYRTLRVEAERARELHAQGLMSDEEYEARERAAEEAKHTADLLELTLQRTIIRAPFSGTVVTRHLDPGANVTNATPVFDLADLRPLYADVDVPERQVGRLSPGQAVRLYPGEVRESIEPIEARIERIAPIVDPATGTVKVTLTVPPRGGLRPGGFVRVQFVTDTRAEALVVPRSALVAEGRRWHVFRVQPDGRTVERLEVVRGYEEREWVEVRGIDGPPPISEGDPVVSVGAPALTDGATVEIAGETSGEAARVGT